VKTDSAHKDAVRELLNDLRLSAAETKVRYEQAVSASYWRELVPTLGCSGTHLECEALFSVDAAAIRETAGRFAEEGYFKLSPLIAPALVERMRAAVAAVQDAGWPPVFAWIFDEFWSVTRARPFADLLTTILGAGYHQTPSIWTHVVPGQRGAAGWTPHVDHRGAGTRVTVWIPLSDATVDSGCMCVLPRHLVPPKLVGRWYDTPTLTMKEAIALIHAGRPLPATAGSVLGWNAELLHWGAAREHAGDPRISYSMEFAAPGRSDPDEDDGEAPIAAANGTLPSFEIRLRAIARGIVIYRESDLRGSRYLPVAHQIRARPRVD